MLRDWVEHGADSRVRAHTRRGRSRARNRARTTRRPRPRDFELGQHLHRNGDHAGAIPHWREAHRLYPDNWTYKRQAWNFEDPVRQGHTDAYDGSWFEDIKKIGAENYYPPSFRNARDDPGTAPCVCATCAVPGSGERGCGSVGGAGAVAAEGAGHRDREHDEAVEAGRRRPGGRSASTCFVTGAIGLPNSVRTAATSTLTGLIVAIHCSTLGSELIGTNALLRNVSGNTSMNATPITASGDRTISPIHVPIQIIADDEHEQQQDRADELDRRSCADAIRRCRPAPSSTTIDSTMPASSAR